ncbi:MAG: SDR family NAD(P)-dependent oxidoreductase [Lachnospiraceae bacterium]|nr:SDR family NAD(P)-dependent oxidoreductase [Lachnospiraceae bacterium]
MKKTILITGASRGIGAAIARRLAIFDGSPSRLILNCNKDTEGLATVIDEIGRAVPDCQIVPMICDLSDAKARSTAFARAVEASGGHTPHILINNAGIADIGLLQDLSSDRLMAILSTNLAAALDLARLCIPGMIRRMHDMLTDGTPNSARSNPTTQNAVPSAPAVPNCAILNISSVWGQVGASCEVAYSAAKGGLNAMTRALAKELAPESIPVNAIACGLIDTQMNRLLSPEELADVISQIPAGRMATPDEVAETVSLILSAPAYLTGQVIGFDGGWI